jgi:hypothetical protein
LPAGGSLNHACSCALLPTDQGLPSALGLAAWKAFQSSDSVPLHWPTVPPEDCVFVRCVGALTHRKLEAFQACDAGR